MMNIDVVTLENNEEYLIVETIINNNNRYVFLANEKNNKDIAIRKVITKDNQEYLTKLDSEEEFEEVLKLFNNKYKGEK